MAAYISFQPSDFYSTLLYTGNGTTGHAITGVGFQPDLVWMKTRENTYAPTVANSVSGVNKETYTSDYAVEYSGSEMLTAFDSDGFTVGTDAGWNSSAGGADEKVTWNWKAGTTTGLSGGDITPSSYSINTTSGFGIYIYTGTSSTGDTIAHGLGTTPEFIIVKGLNYAQNWSVYTQTVGNGGRLRLNTTAAIQTGSDYWDSTSPTSTLITLGANAEINSSSYNYIMYAFAPKKGYSKFGSYTGNGNADGPFIYTGFRPAFVMVKNTDEVQAWNLWNDKTSTSGKNVADKNILPNATTAEQTSVSGVKEIDLLSNGFKVRGSNDEPNGSGKTIVYAAFAEFPLVSSNSIPALAR